MRTGTYVCALVCCVGDDDGEAMYVHNLKVSRIEDKYGACYNDRQTTAYVQLSLWLQDRNIITFFITFFDGKVKLLSIFIYNHI